MQHVVLILPDSKNRLPDASALRKAGFEVSAALGGSAGKNAGKPGEYRAKGRNRDDAPHTADR
jgi:hypothetical protein